MEERPNEGALGRYSNHGKAESNTDRLNKLVNNDQCHCQHQDEETSTKKTGYGKVNGITGEGEEISTALNPNSITHLTHDGGHEDNRRPLEHPLVPRPPPSKTQAAFPRAVDRSRAREGGSISSSIDPLISNMDCTNDRPPDLKTLDGKKEALVSLNGLVVTPSSSCSSSPLTNGYPGKPGGSLTDNDGSGSENGYTTPKKRRNVQRGAKAATAGGEVVIVPSTAAKAMHPAATAGGKQQRPDSPFSAESADKSPAFTPHGNGRTPRELPSASPALPPAEFPRKNSEGKAASGAGTGAGAAAAAGKKPEERPVKAKTVTAAASAAAKDDSWTLFKPPPVFPVDNSSAKIVPKISYASKVKENLNRVNAAAQAVQASSPSSAPATTVVAPVAAAERDPLLPPTQTPSPPMPPGKLSQVPMSAVKTITSASFTNGPLPSAEGGSSSSNNGCPLPGAPFNTPPPPAAPAPSAAAGGGGMASSALASPVQGGENVASPLSSSSATSPGTGVGGVSVAPEPRKPSLFVYPHAAGPPSNMQLSLPSGRQADPPAPPSSSSSSSSSVASGGPASSSSSSSSSSSNPGQPAHQKSLGDIFQNQWGLSFINEPSTGPEGGGGGGGGGGGSGGAEAAASRTEGRGKPTVVTFQGGFPLSSAPLPPSQGSTTSAQRQEHHTHTHHHHHHHHHPPFPKSHELDKRTSPLSSGRVGPLRSSPGPLVAAQEGGLLHTTPSLPSGAPKEPEPRNLSAIVFSSSSAKDQGGDLPQASPTNTAPVLALAREQGHTKGFERSNWGMFDLKAAVIYHTKEMEYILNIQKQDPKRVVIYRDTKDGPNQ